MVPIKDFCAILKAADALNRAGKETRVLLVGDGPELARLQQLAVELPSLAGKAVFAGASARVPEYLQALDAFVLSSLREGMSNTLLEAMATGLPLVATRAGGNPELVEEGRCGWFFQPGEAHALASHLERLHADASLRAQFGHASRRRALAVFSLERMIENYGQLYREAARRRGVLCAAGRPAPENLDKHTDVRVLRHI
jgi:glycosyltransferase involved in cell wall biosynthesis